MYRYMCMYAYRTGRMYRYTYEHYSVMHYTYMYRYMCMYAYGSSHTSEQVMFHVTYSHANIDRAQGFGVKSELLFVHSQ